MNHHFEIVKRKVPEVTYLNTDRTPYYRSILRYFYEEYKKFNSLLMPEDVLVYMQEKAGFPDYTMEALNADLRCLDDWGNLESHLDKGKVVRLVDFRQKRFKYRATEYTISFEETIKRLETERKKGSLSISLVDRLIGELKRLTTYDAQFLKTETQIEDLAQTWDDVFERFKKLMKEIGNYLSHINSLAFEKKIMEDNETYISFKNKFVDYVQKFIISIHGYHQQICSLLEGLHGPKVKELIHIIAQKKANDGNYEQEVTFDEILHELTEEWDGLYQWFMEEGGRGGGFSFMVSQTRETIPRLVSFASYLNEKERQGRNRQMEYLHLARIFLASESMEDCHLMAAVIFGSRTVKELKAPSRTEEKITETVWDHTPYKIPIMSKDRERKERKKKTYVHSDEEARSKATKKYEKERDLREFLLEKLLSMDVIRIRELSPVHPYIRDTLLNWISSAHHSKDWIGYAQGIHKFKLVKHSDDEIELATDDGVLTLDDYELWFIRGEKSEKFAGSV